MLSGNFGCLECGFMYYKATTDNDDYTFLECPKCGSYKTKELKQIEGKKERGNNMKQTKKFIAFQNKENGHFVSEYDHHEKRLAYKVGLCDCMQDALTLDYDAYEEQQKQIAALAESFGCNIVVVEATHEIKMLDGSDAPEPVKRDIKADLFKFLGLEDQKK